VGGLPTTNKWEVRGSRQGSVGYGRWQGKWEEGSRWAGRAGEAVTVHLQHNVLNHQQNVKCHLQGMCGLHQWLHLGKMCGGGGKYEQMNNVRHNKNATIIIITGY